MTDICCRLCIKIKHAGLQGLLLNTNLKYTTLEILRCEIKRLLICCLHFLYFNQLIQASSFDGV